MICFYLFVIEQSCSFTGPCKEQISLTIEMTTDRMPATAAARHIFDHFDGRRRIDERLLLDVAFGTILPAQVTVVGHVENLNRGNEEKRVVSLTD